MNARLASFDSLLAAVRAFAQQGRFSAALALIDQAEASLAQDRDKLALLRFDIASASRDSVAVAQALKAVEQLARSHAASAPKLVASLRLRGRGIDAWQLLQRLDANAVLAPEAFHLGLEFARARDLAAMRAAYEFALRCDSALVPAHINLGGSYLAEREFLRALPHFEAATRLASDHQDGWLGLAQCKLNTGDGAGALAALDRLGGPIAGSALALAWRASATAQCGDAESAAQLYRDAIALDANSFDAWFGLAQIAERRGDWPAVAQASARAWQFKPQSNWALGMLVYSLRCMAAWDEMAAPWRELSARLTRGDVGDYATTLSSLDLPAAVLREVAVRYVRTQSALHVREVRERDFARRDSRRLRIAYLSADFRDHATSRLMAELLERHDRSRFEIFAYARKPNDDSRIGRRVAMACEHFIDVSQLSVQQLGARVLDDGIDILIDLNGHTQGGCMGLAALRPAPVYVNYLGYPGTLGDYADYLIGDAFVTPPGCETEFSEAVVRLPVCYQPNDSQREVGPAATHAAHDLPERIGSEPAIVACSFNQAWKFTPGIWAIWMRLMQRHPRLVLWLLHENPAFVHNLRAQAAAAGVAPDRIVFAPRLSNAGHLARLALADLALDTLPCNSHTTAADALWMGVPLVTLVGDTFAGRVGASLLHAVGLPELVTRSAEEYEAKLDALLSAPERLAALKQALLARRASASLYDSTALARALERAYHAMHQRHAAGLKPATIDLCEAASAR